MPIRTASESCAPAAAATTERFSRQRLVCSPIVPSTSWPVFGSIGTWPLQNTRPFDTTAWVYGPTAPGAPDAVTVFLWWDIPIANQGARKRACELRVTRMSNRLAQETSPYL